MGTSLNGLTPAGTYPGLIKTGDNAPIDGTLKTLSDGNGNNLPMAVSTTTINLTGTAQVGGVAIANTTQVASKQDTLVSGTNIKTINSTSLLGSGNIAVVTSPSGVAGAIQFSNGSAFASDAANFFWDNTTKRLGVRTNTPTNVVDINTLVDYTGFSLTSGANLLANIAKWSNNGGYLELLSGGNYYARLQANQSFLTSPITFGSASSLSAMVGIKGSGSTSATTSLLVQNSSGVTGLTVFDNGNVAVGSVTAGGFYQLYGNGTWLCTGSIGTNQYYLSTMSPNAGGSTNFYGNLNNFKIGTSATATASAVFEVDSTTKGFLPPRMTTTQKNAIATPAAGLVVYDNTTNKLQCYNGSSWNDLF